MTRYAVASEETARRNLGNAIRFYREQRRFTQHRVADICSTSAKTIDAWERGDEIPPDWQWAKLINVMHRDLREYRTLRMRAQAEQRADDENATTQSDSAPLRAPISEHVARIAQRDADELAQLAREEREETKLSAPAIATSVVKLDAAEQAFAREHHMENANVIELRAAMYNARPKPPADVVPLRVVSSSSPKAKMGARERREEYVRNVLRSRPAAKLRGDDGIDMMLRRAFGYGMTYETFYRIRDEVHAECRAPHVHQQHAREPEPVATKTTQAASTVAADLRMPSPHDPKQEIAAVLAMLRETVPNLASLTVTTDASGELRCKYKLREVTITEVESDLTV